jgi:hypothetical protein
VDEALAARDSALAEGAAELAECRRRLEAERGRIAQLELVCDRLSDRLVTRERELGEVRAKLARLRDDGDRRIRALAGLAAELKDVRRQARGQATRIRLRALRDAAELSDRIAELAKRPPAARERLIGALVESIRRIGEAAEAAEREEADGATDDRRPARLAEVFEGLVEVEIGPLADFSQLVGFEDAAKSIAATSEISVKRFSEGRATLAMTLKEPVELLRELEERCDVEFVVRDLRADRLVLDVGA